MGRVSGRRTGRGFAALRDRYITRAEFLCQNPKFLEIIKTFQRDWQAQYAEFPLHVSRNSDPSLFPWVLVEGDNIAFDPPHAAYELSQLDSAIRTWYYYVHEITKIAFPRVNFYRTAPPSRTRGMAFIRACLTCDPRLLIGRVEEFFPLEGLELTLDDSEYREIGITPEEWELDHPSQTWYIPVYPGMTAKDLEAAIPTIVGQVEQRLGPRTVGARIEALAADGCTQQAIAEALAWIIHEGLGRAARACHQASLG